MKAPLPLIAVLAITGAGVLGFLYQNANRKVEELQASNQKLSLDRESLARQAEELKAMVKTRGTLALAPAATIVTNSASVVELTQLRRQLAEAEEKLAKTAEKQTEKPAIKPSTTPETPAKPEDAAANYVKRMEDWKARDPEGFERMAKSMEERRVEMNQGLQDRLAFINGIDVSGLNEDYVKNHKQVVEKLQKVQELFAQVTPDPLNPENMKNGREAYGMLRELDDSLKKEREVLLYDLASEAGYQGDKAREFVQYVDQVHKLTSTPRFGRGRGGPGGFPGGDGARPPDGGR